MFTELLPVLGQYNTCLIIGISEDIINNMTVRCN